MNKHLVVIEKANGDYSAYAPDLPGCVATGKTLEEVKARMREAIKMHIEALREDGMPIPPPRVSAEYLTV